MQPNSTQIARAIGQLDALTGSLDALGGNVLFPAVPTGDVVGQGLLSVQQGARTLGLRERPLGPSRWQHVTSDEVYRGILEQQPYAVRGLVGFGANLLLSHADGGRGREALAALDFYVHADLFMNPTAELADVVLPVTSAFECEALKVGFEVSQEAQSLVQLRQRVVEPKARLAPISRLCSIWHAVSVSALTSGMAILRLLIVTNLPRLAFRLIRCARTRAECGCRSRHGTANSPSGRMVFPKASTHRHGRLSCTQRLCWTMAIHHFQSMKSHW
jgi:hypothetical protein